MSLAIVNSRAQVGTEAPSVTVEVLISSGLPSFSIVGLPETAVKESKDRVRGAIINSKFKFPSKRISVNLAPADLPKVGARFDLPIALGVLAASGQIPKERLENLVFLGELALSGVLRKVTGGLNSALALRKKGLQLVLPKESAEQASLIEDVTVYGVSSLSELTHILHGFNEFSIAQPCKQITHSCYPNMKDVIGQEFAKLAMEVSACGDHSLLMMGSPGTGKTMLANRLPGILPAMSQDEGLETAAINTLFDKDWQAENWRIRPFRSPHHSSSGAALIGGGTIPKPGEISRAHNGVLFLDELTEFNQSCLELLREPMESGFVNIARASMQVRFLSRFLFVGAANPCRCGYLGDPSGACNCTPDQISKYISRLSGPLLDRIDIQINVAKATYNDIAHSKKSGEDSDGIRSRVELTRKVQLTRQNKLNRDLDPDDIEQHCKLNFEGDKLMKRAFERFNLSARAYHRILKLARTLADMNRAENINIDHLSTAIKMRCMDNKKNYSG